MPRYSVIVTRDATESTVVEVAAKDADEAEEKAAELAELDPSLEWTVDDGNFHRPYTNGAEEISSSEYRTRADLLTRPLWRGMEVDSCGNPCVWMNYYDGFEDCWSCQCDEDGEAPYHSEWIGPLDPAELLLWESLPDAS